jgi:DNA-binding transcriptional regulator YdaS (Cro superfamily)
MGAGDVMKKGLAKAIKAAGGLRALARQLGISHPAIMHWTEVPAHHLIAIEQATGIPREELRPDLYRKKRAKVS